MKTTDNTVVVTGNPGSSPLAEQAWADREEGQARAYDAIGAHYDDAFPHKDGQLAVVTAMLERVGASGARVLDVGAGTGLPTARPTFLRTGDFFGAT